MDAAALAALAAQAQMDTETQLGNQVLPNAQTQLEHPEMGDTDEAADPLLQEGDGNAPVTPDPSSATVAGGHSEEA